MCIRCPAADQRRLVRSLGTRTSHWWEDTLCREPHSCFWDRRSRHLLLVASWMALQADSWRDGSMAMYCAQRKGITVYSTPCVCVRSCSATFHCTGYIAFYTVASSTMCINAVIFKGECDVAEEGSHIDLSHL